MSQIHGAGRPRSGLHTVSTTPRVGMPPGTPTLPGRPASPESGRMQYGSTGSMVYVDSSHWTSILDSLSELRDCLGGGGRQDDHVTPHQDQHDQSGQPPDLLYGTPRQTGPHLLSGFNRIPTKAELLSAIPDRSVVDRHIFWYFNRLPMRMTSSLGLLEGQN